MSQPERPTIFTIVSRNYAAQACVLMTSLASHEPGADLIVVVSDGVLSSSEVGGARVLQAGSLVTDLRLQRMSTYYDALELNTALKPFCFQALLQTAERVVYLDPDICLYADLEPVWRAFDTSDILLTPHLLSPMRTEGRPDNTDILKAGVYNLGFLGLRRSPEAQAFANWWGDRCTFDCRVDFASGLFTDQRWVDMAPGFIRRTGILRDPGLNVAYWNLAERPLTRRSNGWQADEKPLRFFHFSGFDPERPDLLSKHQSRISVDPASPLSRLLESYATAMKRAGSKRALKRPYAFNAFTDGRLVTPQMRKAFLQAARSGRDLSGGLDYRQSAWIDSPDPQKIASDRPLSWAGGPWSPPSPPVNQPAISDEAWPGPAKEAGTWLVQDGPNGQSRAIEAFRRARPDLMAMQPLIEADLSDVLLALCAGPEAVRGRFSTRLLSPRVAARLTGSAVVRQVAQLSRPGAVTSEALARVIVCYSIGPAANWPEAIRARLQDACDDPAMVLWRDRPDLQALFDIRRPLGRIKLARWFSAVGVAEYNLKRSLLAPTVRFDPSVGRAPKRKDRKLSGRADSLLCAPARLAGEISELTWYETTMGNVVGGVPLPARAGLCVHYGELAEAALGWIAMHRRGVAVEQHVWAPSPQSAHPATDDPAWTFVDAVAQQARSNAGYPRPISTSQVAMKLRL